jgi:hypothetical protein
MSDDAADSTEFDLILESPPRPIKRAQMDMDALRGALAGVQGERGSHSGVQASSPIIEMGDPFTHDLPDGSGDENDFEPSPALENDDNTAMEVDEVEMEGSEEQIEGKGASVQGDAAEIGALIDVENGPDGISGLEDAVVNIAGNQHLTQSSPSGNDHVVEAAAAAKDNETAAMKIAQNNDQKKAEDSGEQVGAEQANEENNDVKVLDATGADGVDDVGEDVVEEDNTAQEPEDDGDIDRDDRQNSSGDQANEPNPRKWRDTYAEYKSWPRKLKIIGTVELLIHNRFRRDMLKRLSQREKTGEPCWLDDFPDDGRKAAYDCLELDLKNIRAAVQSAMAEGPREGNFRTLAEVIHWDEANVEYDKATDTLWSLADEEAEDAEEEESTKWRDTYAEYKAFPRKLKIYDHIWLRLFNAERKSAIKALSRAEARGKSCYIDELDEEERKDLYENIEHDMEAIRTVVRDAAKRKYHSGPCDSLAQLIDWSEDEIEYDDGESESFNPEDEDAEDEDGDSAMAD